MELWIHDENSLSFTTMNGNRSSEISKEKSWRWWWVKNASSSIIEISGEIRSEGNFFFFIIMKIIRRKRVFKNLKNLNLKIEVNDCWKLLRKIGSNKKVRKFFKLIQFGNEKSWKQGGNGEKNDYYIKLSRKLEDETRNEISRRRN